MMKIILNIFLINFLINLAAAEKARYDNYRVYEVLIANDIHLELVKEIQNNPDGYRFMDFSNDLNSKLKLIVPPHKFAEFSELIEEFEIKSRLVIKNLQDLIDLEKPKRHRRSSTLDWTRYWNLDEINAWLQALTVSYPSDVSVINIGNSYEGRPILCTRVNIGGGSNKKSIVFEGTHHAKEWISAATVTWMLNELLTSQDPEVRLLAETYDWYILPVTNPDGYAYTWSHDRYWRKTRRPVSQFCKGADLNRNWDNNFNKAGTSSNPCYQIYAGTSAFSEPEAKQLAEFLRVIPNLAGYFTFHAFAQVLMMPYGYTKELLDNYQELHEIGLKGIEALKSKFGTEYQLGSIGNVMYLATGASIDWVKQELKVNVTFEYEMRDTGYYGFSLLPDQIIPNSIEVFASIVTILNESQKIGIA